MMRLYRIGRYYNKNDVSDGGKKVAESDVWTYQKLVSEIPFRSSHAYSLSLFLSFVLSLCLSIHLSV